jgi:hypothetical protein
MICGRKMGMSMGSLVSSAPQMSTNQTYPKIISCRTIIADVCFLVIRINVFSIHALEFIVERFGTQMAYFNISVDSMSVIKFMQIKK